MTPGENCETLAVRNRPAPFPGAPALYKSPSLVRCLPVVTTMAHINRSYHQGYSFPDSFQSFTMQDWEVWMALYVCVIHFVFTRMYALTDLVHRRARPRLSH